MLYIIYGLIILITIVLYFLVNDKKEYINKLGKAALISGIIILLLGLMINISLNIFLNNFNTLKISSLIFQKFIHNSIIIIIVGIFLLLISKIKNKREWRLLLMHIDERNHI